MRWLHTGRPAPRIVAIAAAAALVGVGCTGTAGHAARRPGSAPRLTGRHPCTQAAGFVCATLTVPLDRGHRSARTRRLRLKVAISDNGAPGRTLLYLTGGPGEAGVPLAERITQAQPHLLDHHRLVMLDQRGTGDTALRCPRLQAQVGGSDTAVPDAAVVKRCARSIGGSRRFYTTSDTVADLDDLRRALGVRRWSVDGISYGTFVAQRYALAHPRHVARLVLDSVVPAEDVSTLYAAPFRRVRRVLRAACRDRNCGHDPAADVATVLRHGGDAPGLFNLLVVASVADPRYEKYDILGAVHAAARGDDQDLKQLIDGFRTAGGAKPEAFSAGLHAATLCADIRRAPWGDSAAPMAGRRTALRAAVRRVRPSAVRPFAPRTLGAQGIAQTCLNWPSTRPNPRAAHRTLRMPVLLLAGDRDLSTPVTWARRQARRMPHGTLKVVRGAGHDIQVRSKAGPSLALRFLTR